VESLTQSVIECLDQSLLQAASDCTTVDNNLHSNITEKSDIDNSVDKDTITDEKTPTDGTETNRSSNRARKIPASRYSDFLWDS
jgi:hypothetical protein